MRPALLQCNSLEILSVVRTPHHITSEGVFFVVVQCFNTVANKRINR